MPEKGATNRELEMRLPDGLRVELLTAVVAAPVRRWEVAADVVALSAQDECNNQTVQTQDLGEDKNEDHADEELQRGHG